MLLLIVFLTGLFVVIGTGLLAAVSDVRGLVIPNLYSVIVAGAFFTVYAILWIGGREDVFFSLSSHLFAAVLVFIITLLMFAAGGLGAGDSKLGTAYALWVGVGGLPAFLVYMTLCGGVLGLAALFIQKYKPFKIKRTQGWLASLQSNESHLPYGVAIVFGALASFMKLGYFNSEVLRSFLLG